jgi:hypothetical protein
MTGVAEDLANRRRGIGTVNHCAHGKDVSIEEVLDWVPPEYVTKRITMPFPGVPRFLVMTELVARGPDRTDLVYRVGRPRSAKDRRTLEAIWDQIRPGLLLGSEALIELAAADAAERAATRGAEPDIPASPARHLSAPNVAGGQPFVGTP